MKKQFLFLVFWCTAIFGFSQNENIAGKWTGTMTLSTLQPERIIRFTVHFRQQGNVVWGIYANGDFSTLDSCDCAGKLISKLSEKDNKVILIYQDGIIEHNKIPLDVCTALNFLQVYYSKEGDEEFLRGKWFEVPENPQTFDRASGSFALKKVNTTADFDVDQYFPRLSELIKKFQNK